MDTFVPPGWMTRTELVERAGKVRFKDRWLGAIPTTAELLQAYPELTPGPRDAVRRARAGRSARSPEAILSQKLAKLLAAERAEEPKKAEMHDEVINTLREPLCSGVIPWGALSLSGFIEEGPAVFWQGERAIPAFDTEKAILGRELQTPIGRVLARAVTGRVLFKRAEAEAWLASLNATSTTIAAETRAKEWFWADVERGEKRYTRPGYCDEMVRQFGISKRGATRIWDAEAPDLWRKPGRPKRTESPQKLSH